MTSDTERQFLKLVANGAAFEYVMYVPTSFSHRSGLLYKREYERMAVWNSLVGDSGLLRLAVAALSIHLQRIIHSASGSGRHDLEIHCTYMRESLLQADANAIADASSTRGSHGVFEKLAVGEF